MAQHTLSIPVEGLAGLKWVIVAWSPHLSTVEYLAKIREDRGEVVAIDRPQSESNPLPCFLRPQAY